MMTTRAYDEDSEAIYGNSDTILFHYITTSGELVGSVKKSEEYHGGDFNSSEREAEEYDYDDFTSDEEETEDAGQQEIQLKEEENVQQVQEENIQGDSCNAEDEYVVPISPGLKSIPPRIANRWPPQPPLSNNSSQHHQGCQVPRKLHPSSKEMDSAMNSAFPHPKNNRRSPGPPLVAQVKRKPVPLPVQKASPWNKASPKTSYPSLLQDSSSGKADHSSFAEFSQKGPTETGGSTVKKGSFLYQQKSFHGPQVDKQHAVFPKQFQQSGPDETGASAKSSPVSCKAFPQESNAPLECPPVSTAKNSPFVRLENGEQIILTPLYQRILGRPYFHLISRDLAKDLVMKGGNGAFLVRPSTKSGKPLTITVSYGDRPYHINIRQRPDNLYALGSLQYDEQTFSTIDEIISTHHEKPIKLLDGAGPTLKYSPLKTSNVYVHHAVPGRRRNQ